MTKKQSRRYYAATLGLGCFASLAMAPHNFWPSIFVGLSGLYICLNNMQTPFKSALTGFLFSFGYFGLSLSWIGHALLIDGNPYWWAWPIAVTALPALLSLFTGAACWAHHISGAKQKPLINYIIFCICIMTAEHARGHLFTGFPWNLYGYTWINTPQIAQIAHLGNIYILTFVTIIWATLPALIIMHKRTAYYVIPLFLISITASLYYGESRLAQSSSLPNNTNFVIIQPNIAQSEKWKIEKRQENFLTLTKLSKFVSGTTTKNHENTYIIWPETATSQDVINSAWARNIIKSTLSSYPNRAYLITGALRHDPQTGHYFNSIITFNKNAEIIYTYDKMHLVPFGEYMPLENIIDIAPIVGFSGFQKGKNRTLITLAQGLTALPLICYEVIFPNEINTQTPKSNIIINVTNDAWYGNSAGPHQHLVQAQFRAIETGIPVIRAANTGISAVIDSHGQPLQALSIETSGTIKTDGTTY